MRGLGALTKRNCKLYFKDKGMFLTSLITPLILFVLYATFLSDVFEESFRSSVEAAGTVVSDKLIGGFVGGELISSILAVCCVTVAFCSNLVSVNDKITGARNDLMIAPVKSGTLALGYCLSTFLSTFLICIVASGIFLVYLAFAGWYLSAADAVLILLDVFLMVLFGTALSSCVVYPLKTNGQASAVGTIVSAGYGFICGAYMPISSFSQGLQKALSFLPGTYGTSLFRNHALGGVLEEMSKQGFPNEVIDGIRDSVDCNIYFFGTKVEIGTMYAIVCITIAVLIGLYIILNAAGAKKHR